MNFLKGSLFRRNMEPEELENIGVRNRRHSNEALL